MTRDPFVKDFGKLLLDFDFEAYWPNKPIEISKLKTSIKEPRQIEIDIVARIGSIGFLVEATTQRDKNEDKIRKFISKYRAITESKLPMDRLVDLFSGVQPEKKESFSNRVKEWRSIYIGTSLELIHKNITPSKFTDGEGLTIINLDDWNYITALRKAIGGCARFEFMSFLGVNPDKAEGIDDADRYLDYHKVEERSITRDSLDADIFLFDASPDFLLRTCKVFRFVGLRSKDSERYYQRMLNKRKLDEIRKDFIGKSFKCSFPTPITVVLPPGVRLVDRDGAPKVAIPFKYGSLELIDGQHRLYAYASTKISEEIRKDAKLLVNGIQFKSNDIDKIRKSSARTFIDINREQVKVKTSLFYLISYDVMGDTSSKSIAGKIISLCDSDADSPLHDLFEGIAVGRKSKLGFTRTSIVEVTNSLAKIVEKISDSSSLEAQNVAKMLGMETFSTEASELIEIGKKLMNKHFNRVKNVLPNDWKKGTRSVIFRSKYMAAFILLLLDSIENGNSFMDIENRVRNISNNIKSTSEWKESSKNIINGEQNQIFHKDRGAIPNVRFGTGRILKIMLWYENHDSLCPELE